VKIILVVLMLLLSYTPLKLIHQLPCQHLAVTHFVAQSQQQTVPGLVVSSLLEPHSGCLLRKRSALHPAEPLAARHSGCPAQMHLQLVDPVLVG